MNAAPPAASGRVRESRGTCPIPRSPWNTSWLMLQADYDLKTLPNRQEIERVVRRA